MPAQDAFPFAELARWFVANAGNGAGQMALDEVMLLRTDLPVLRLYRWAAPSATFGYPQRWRDACELAGGRPLIRRCTGGGLVAHGEDLTIALAVPASHAFSRLAPAESYRQIHRAILDALGGADLRLANGADCVRGPACFASPAPGDVLHRGRKIAGGALRRSRDGFLYQGSIQNIVLPEDFCARFESRLARRVSPWVPGPGWEQLRDDLVCTRYGAAEWNRRR